MTVLLWVKAFRPILKLLDLKWMIDLELISIKVFLGKVRLKIGQDKYLLSNLF